MTKGEIRQPKKAIGCDDSSRECRCFVHHLGTVACALGLPVPRFRPEAYRVHALASRMASARWGLPTRCKSIRRIPTG